MSYKLIVTDMDDTLLDANTELQEINKKAIIKAQQLGIKFILASGRPTYGMWSIAKELMLPEFEGYILSYNGSVITNCKTKEIVFETGLSKEDIHFIYDLSKEYNTDILTYKNDEIVSPMMSEYIEVDLFITKMPHRLIDNFKEYMDLGAPKCLLLSEPSHLEKVEKELKKKYGDLYSIFRSKPIFLEIISKDINKGTAIEKLGEFLGIKNNEMIAIGDSYNDLDMIKKAGLGVAVENADDYIKKHADFVTTSNDNNGVAHVIEKFIFNQFYNINYFLFVKK
ncbi:MAG: Cof-type HAD-IIB family hydrolase [Fusobacteriaceae bacterium]|jgi:Cof subfamily protein (haloacid dehalogenase superfamily)|nr:Cof-type HAD-IIB family hydrolase [Fusobacteriaceae bacterium]